MSEQVLRNGNAMARSKTRTVTQIAMLGAIAGILMNLEFPLPFLAPTFYQLDFQKSRYWLAHLQWDRSQVY